MREVWASRRGEGWGVMTIVVLVEVEGALEFHLF